MREPLWGTPIPRPATGFAAFFFAWLWVSRSLSGTAVTAVWASRSAIRYSYAGTVDSSGAVRQMTVRVTDEELHSWKVAAAIRGVTLSEWVRRVLNATAAKTKEGA
jgi:hypothetical protein